MPDDQLPTVDHEGASSVEGPDATLSFQPSAAIRAKLTGDAELPAIPGFVISSEIARGGMGRVLSGTEMSLEREVAIKVLLPGANTERFISESKITARLPHPSIPPIYSLGTLADGSPYLAMKFVHGRTLAAELKARPTALHEMPRFVQVFEQICQAVGFAHAQNIIHRDLKPANVMLGAFGEVQVMDWGLAKELMSRERERPENSPRGDSPQDSLSSELTRAGTVMGTPAYMAPEQARGEGVDARADVFALGGILCNMLTGKGVHTGLTVAETIQKAATGELAETLSRLDSSGADAELVSIAKRCLSPNREDRPATGEEVAKLIAAYRQGVEARLHEAEAERAAGLVREAEQTKRRRLFLRLGGAIAAVLVLGIAGTTYGFVEARQSANEERIAKTKAQSRLNLIRSTINKFANDLPSIGEHLPLSDALRQELLEQARELIPGIRDQNDSNDTYDYGIHAITLFEARKAKANGDTAVARTKLISARDGFQKILESNPQALDRSRNNLAITLVELGELDDAEKNYPAADANYQQALSLSRECVETPQSDYEPAENELRLAATLVRCGQHEAERSHFDSATAMIQEANVVFEKHLKIERDPRKYEKLRLYWVSAQLGFAQIANAMALTEQDKPKEHAHREKAVQIYVGIIRQLQDDLNAAPDSAGLRSAMAMYAAFVGRYFFDFYNDPRRALEYCEIAVRNRRWFWNSKEISDLGNTLGGNYYELGIFANLNKQPDIARKHFRNCLAFWDLGVRDLEETGEPVDSLRMIDRKTVRMLAQGRCGMHVEAAAMAGELMRLAAKSEVPAKRQQDLTILATTGYGFAAVACPPGSKERIEYFKQAMTALRQAVACGWNNWHYLETDPDLDCMQDLPEFQEAIKEWRARDAKKK